MATLYAQPYAMDSVGFEFDSYDDYEAKAAAHDREEFEIQFLDGDPADGELFELASIALHNLSDYFDALELEDYEKVQLAALLQVGVDFDEAQRRWEDVQLGEYDDVADWAGEHIDSFGGPEALPAQTLAAYFDYERFGRDAEIGGDIFELNFAGKRYYVETASVER